MSEAQGFNIEDLNRNDGPVTHQVAVIEDEDGNPVTGFIIVGKNSPEYQKAAQDVRIDNIKRAAKRKTQIDSSTDLGASIIAKTVAANDRTVALAVVVGWFGVMSNGQLLSFNKELVEKMFDKYPQWQVQVLNALEDDANFMTGSSKP